MNILICTIIRNNARHIDRYWKQINDTIVNLKNKNINWYISIYENDSIDGTKEKITELDMSNFVDSSVICENLGTQQYQTGCSNSRDADRVLNLAAARNKAVEAKNLYLLADIILWIEPDVEYSEKFIPILLLRTQLLPTGFDIFSGISVQEGYFYDNWATRRTSDEDCGSLYDDRETRPIAKFYSTFNCVCMYNAKPFKDGIRFGAWNKRFNKYDCDTAVICESFHEAGFDRIYIDQSSQCYHLKD